jgi:hypothetical protein
MLGAHREGNQRSVVASASENRRTTHRKSARLLSILIDDVRAGSSRFSASLRKTRAWSRDVTQTSCFEYMNTFESFEGAIAPPATSHELDISHASVETC